MHLQPAVKKFIEENIKAIEESDVDAIISEASWDLTDGEFTQLYHILTDDIELEYDLDETIHDYIKDIVKEIIKENNEEHICIEDEWLKWSKNYLDNYDYVIEQFDDFESDIYNGKHWCTVYC